jgi:hypothetical protein
MNVDDSKNIFLDSYLPQFYSTLTLIPCPFRGRRRRRGGGALVVVAGDKGGGLYTWAGQPVEEREKSEFEILGDTVSDSDVTPWCDALWESAYLTAKLFVLNPLLLPRPSQLVLSQQESALLNNDYTPPQIYPYSRFLYPMHLPPACKQRLNSLIPSHRLWSIHHQHRPQRTPCLLGRRLPRPPLPAQAPHSETWPDRRAN